MFEDILKVAFKEEEIKIGNKMYFIREMSGKEDGEYSDTLLKVVNGEPVYDLKNAKLKLVAICLFEGDKRVFNKEDFGVVEQLPASLINEIFEIAAKLNNLDEAKTEKN